MQTIFLLIASLIGIYSLLCLIRIVISWIPQAQGNAFAHFLSRICDPFFAMFRFSFAQIGSFDLSPVFALLTLYVAEQFLRIIGTTNNFNAFSFIGILLNLVIIIFSSIVSSLIIILIIRLIIELTGRASISNYCTITDSILSPVYRIASSITNRNDRRLNIIVSIAIMFAIMIAMRILLGLLKLIF